MYQYLSKMPTSQMGTDIGDLKKTLGFVNIAEKSHNKNDPHDNIGKFCE